MSRTTGETSALHPHAAPAPDLRNVPWLSCSFYPPPSKCTPLCLAVSPLLASIFGCWEGKAGLGQGGGCPHGSPTDAPLPGELGISGAHSRIETQSWGRETEGPPLHLARAEPSPAVTWLPSQPPPMGSEPRTLCLPQPLWDLPLQTRAGSLPHPIHPHTPGYSWGRAAGALWALLGFVLLPVNSGVGTEGQKSEAPHLFLRATAS